MRADRNKDWPYWAMVVFIAMVAVYASNARSQPLAIHAGGYSYHVATGHEVDYNDWHRLAAVEYGSHLVAYFKNSYGRDSFIAARGWSKQWGDFRGSIHIGAVYGYRSCFGDEGEKRIVCPITFPSLYWTKYDVQPGMIVFGEAVALTVRVEL